ncbi:universal stress protein [Natrinema altunense]|uniref:UspA domain-containing protein n=1 Tax=Natrinema altunense (strain JCM 12890 / CGMCC 1.3731 / AJ2) TaxID=1227494 RepID=M0A0D7_NATA2|nr:universal stress protein [Natrinema altunense]ELY92044.1 UspA domain-containing protein [Natrinema altunense JCM 12890]
MSPTLDAIDSVLLPTDGSDGALAGAKRGVDLAAMADATVHVLSVIETSTIDGVSSALESASAVDEQRAALEADAEAAVESVATMVRDRKPGLEVTTTTERGTPFRVIDRYVDARDIDAIAMGTTGRTGLTRAVLGSVTENVLRTVGVPVLVVPPAASESRLTESTVENVLVPTDGSDGAAVAVDWGSTLAAAFDAMVHAIYSVETSRFPPQLNPGEMLAELERPGEEALQEVRDHARERGVSLAGTIATGPPARVILDYAADNEIDLITMGTHGRSGLERHFLGSVTETVVRNAERPVVCVPMSGE